MARTPLIGVLLLSGLSSGCSPTDTPSQTVDGDDLIDPSSASAGTTTTSGGVTSAASATGMIGTSGATGSTSVADDESGVGPVLFDSAPIPDAPDDMGFVGIPSTCAEAENGESTVGCSFRGNRMENFQEYDASIVVGNVSVDQPVMAQLYFTTAGGETAEGAPVLVDPLGIHEFVLNMPTTPGSVSVHRQAGTYRVESDFPIVAYQHSPIGAIASNDSSMLIPDHALGQFYIVASWPMTVGSMLSAFNVIGVEDGTTVNWTPREASQAGAGVAAVAAFRVRGRPRSTTTTCCRLSLAGTCPGRSSKRTSPRGSWERIRAPMFRQGSAFATTLKSC